MQSVTKNRITDDAITLLLNKHFPGLSLISSEELTGGMFNAAYKLNCGDGQSTRSIVLKLGPVPGTKLLDYEAGIMQTEVEVYGLLPRDIIPAPAILCADFSRTVVNSDLFFMEYIEGTPWDQLLDDVTAENRAALMYELGRYNAAIHRTRGTFFGYPKQDMSFRHSTWGAAFTDMVERILQDGLRQQHELPYAEIRALLAKYRGILDEITEPALVSFDMWAGNVFLKKSGDSYKISGVVDFERAFYGDKTADFTSAARLFNDVEKEPEFRKGYESISCEPLVITENDRARMILYNVYMMLLLHVETYRYEAEYAEDMKARSKGWLLKLMERL